MRMSEIQEKGVGDGRGHMVTLATNSKTHDGQTRALWLDGDQVHRDAGLMSVTDGLISLCHCNCNDQFKCFIRL